jgi:hypothetical protein
MKMQEIEVGATYSAKIRGSIVSVKILSLDEHGGYNTQTRPDYFGMTVKCHIRKVTRFTAVNLNTGRQITLKSTSKLIRKIG